MEMGSIHGRVTDQDGENLPGVVVTVEGVAIPGERTAVTRANGEYEFREIPPGEYQVTAVMTGFKTAKSNARVGLGQSVHVDFTLVPESIVEE